PFVRIDPHALHRAQVDHEGVVGDAQTREAVPAAAHRGRQAVRARELDRRDDVGDAGAAGNQAGTPVDRTVPDLPRLVVAGIVAADEVSSEACGELRDRGLLQGQSFGDGSHGLSLSPDGAYEELLPSGAR